MNISELLTVERIRLDCRPAPKNEVLDTAISCMDRFGVLSDAAQFRESVLRREREFTTGVGDGVALPHGQSEGVRELALFVMVFPEGTDFESFDGQKTQLLFLIAVPKRLQGLHLKLISRLSGLLLDGALRRRLVAAGSPEEFLALLEQAERERFAEEPKTQKDVTLLAVTACPTGIAHTYMAAEALEKAGRELGIALKVETNGASGVENALTAEEIRQAKAVIIAADREVDMERFQGKRLIQARVADGIYHPEELLQRALHGGGTIYAGRNDSAQEPRTHRYGKWYELLMSGLSAMLPLAIGGGILTAIAFLLDPSVRPVTEWNRGFTAAQLCYFVGARAMMLLFPVLSGFLAKSIGGRSAFAAGFVGGALVQYGEAGLFGALAIGLAAGWITLLLQRGLSILPKAMDGIKSSVLYPVLGIFFVGLTALLLINPLFSSWNKGLMQLLRSLDSTNRIVFGALLGGMMAVDFGGPVNKTAYLFATASLIEGPSQAMAAAMAGGMVPPIAIAVAMSLFPKKYTADEKKLRWSSLLFGASFITEGAIPFAAVAPLRVIPPCVAGAAVAGALSMLWQCAIRTPHGGLWVIQLMAKPWHFLAALALGALAAGVLLGLARKEGV
ncbi:MAG: fructose-specific PTS transporter subunit EIIC [Ndongobacter sp.]|nr:fructose-specific PTS transporter subunit EIIC [Ndongobacter sp.]